jgi:hypothetical protein
VRLRTQVIRAIILSRRSKRLDKCRIEGKTGVIQDFRQTMAHKYSWEVPCRPRRSRSPRSLQSAWPSQVDQP